jgi:hypothetical protein
MNPSTKPVDETMANTTLENVHMKITSKSAKDAENIVTRHGFRSKAQAVAESLALTNIIGEAAKEYGARLILEYPDGTRERLTRAELGLA